VTALAGAAAIVGAGADRVLQGGRAQRDPIGVRGDRRGRLADGGLTPADVDALVSYTIDPVEETEIVRAIDAPQIRWSSRVPYGGGGSQGVLLHAAAAVASGAAPVVVVYRAIKARSGGRFGAGQAATRPTSSHSGSTAM
jgi:hypothetical protein